MSEDRRKIICNYSNATHYRYIIYELDGIWYLRTL